MILGLSANFQGMPTLGGVGAAGKLKSKKHMKQMMEMERQNLKREKRIRQEKAHYWRH